MHLLGAFELDIQPGTPDAPATVKIALLRYTRGEDGRLLITPECTSFDEIEGEINSLQDELDELRERARRAFQVTRSHVASEAVRTPILKEPRWRGSAASWRSTAEPRLVAPVGAYVEPCNAGCTRIGAKLKRK
jgi:hypothetical protein